MTLSAFDLDCHRGVGGMSKSTALLGKECVRLLRQRIEDAPDSVTDCTIQAVLSLIIIEVSLASDNDGTFVNTWGSLREETLKL